uniref:MFS domain-containing protein n=1 Tax=Rhabditophanes sp. KR3021 TaxID=114890 RepID=A0AC35U2B7_9BILA
MLHLDLNNAKTDWYSISISYVLLFLAGVQITVYYTSMWTYLQFLDPASDINILGVIIASFSVGQGVASPIFGWWCQKSKEIKVPTLVGCAFIIVGNALYAILPNCSSGSVFTMFLVSRVLVGIGAASSGILRAYIATACIPEDRRKVVSLAIAMLVGGVTVGPLIQACFTGLGISHDKIGFFTINMFTMPAIVQLVIYIIGTIVFWLKFEPVFIGIEEPEKSKQSVEDQSMEDDRFVLPKYDMTAIVVCNFINFVQSSIGTNLEALATVLVISMYNWTDQEAILYNGLLIAASSFLSCKNYFLQAFSFVKNIDQRKLLLFGLFVFLSFHVLNYPFFFYSETLDFIPLGENSTVEDSSINGGCSRRFAWCEITTRVPVSIYIATMIICLGYGFPYTFNPNSTLYSDVLGPRRQNSMMGVFEAVGAFARVIGPIIGGYLFNISGPKYTMIFQSVLLVLAIFTIVFYWKRLVPLKLVIKSSCRYLKCKQLGMASKSDMNVEVGTNLTSDTSTKPNSVPSVLCTSVNSVVVEENQVIYDFQPTISYIRTIFLRKAYENQSTIKFTFIQIAVNAFNNFQRRMPTCKKKDVVVEQVFNVFDTIDYFQRFAMNTAEMLMEFAQFESLVFDEKWHLYRHFLLHFFPLVKMYNSLEVFGFDYHESIFMLDQMTAHRVAPMRTTNQQFNDETGRKLSELFEPVGLFLEEFVYLPMKLLRMDKEEMGWIILQILFTRKNIAGIKIETSLYHEEILKVASNELINYYFAYKKDLNYIWRTSEMIKLIDKLKQYTDRERDVFLVARVFDILDCTMLETELRPIYK